MVETEGTKIGYSIIPNDPSSNWIKASQSISEKYHDSYLVSPKRYKSKIIEEIPAGQYSSIPKIRKNEENR